MGAVLPKAPMKKPKVGEEETAPPPDPHSQWRKPKSIQEIKKKNYQKREEQEAVKREERERKARERELRLAEEMERRGGKGGGRGPPGGKGGSSGGFTLSGSMGKSGGAYEVRVDHAENDVYGDGYEGYAYPEKGEEGWEQDNELEELEGAAEAAMRRAEAGIFGILDHEEVVPSAEAKREERRQQKIIAQQEAMAAARGGSRAQGTGAAVPGPTGQGLPTKPPVLEQSLEAEGPFF